MFDTDLKYILDYELINSVDTIGCSCPEWDYCRCNQIEGIKSITNLNGFSFEFTDDIMNYFEPDSLYRDEQLINRYLVERYIRRSLNSVDDFEIEKHHDYYGEELDWIRPANHQKMDDEILELFALCDLDKIHYLLGLEYGFLPPTVREKKTVTVEEVALDDIYIGDKNHFKNASRNKLYNIPKRYISSIPLAVCYENNGHYHLLDGYNRVASVAKIGEKFFVILLK